jgi:hypothetical protein
MPSGGITITPGKILADGEKVSNAKLNQGFRPVGRVDEGAISTRELEAGIATVINALHGRNLLCNGSFQLWANPNYTGLQAGGYVHDYGAVERWVIANDANRAVTRQQFTSGSLDIPSGVDFLRWIQSSAVTPNPSYIGQRLEDVRRFSGLKAVFSIYLRAATDLSVTPKVRQVFGGVKRTIQSSVGSIGSASGVYIDSARSFRAGDQGAGIVITGSGFGPITSTITTVTDEGGIVIADTSGGAATGLTAVITGLAGSAAVVTAGTVLPLLANVWTRLEQVFDVPSISGKTIPDIAQGSFTEFRVEVPQGATFQIDFANAQLEFATGATAFERRLLHEDIAYARFYTQGVVMNLSNDITVWKPFITLDDKRVRPTFILVPTAGTGGKVELRVTNFFIFQSVNHSAIAPAFVLTDSEIRD